MKIKNVGWSIGSYCNARCKHCYSWKMRSGTSDILTKQEIDIIIDKLINYKIETINFGGNEPIFTNGNDVSKTMLPYIINRFYEAKIACGITTNGFTASYLYDNFKNEFLKVNDWDFSLDSPNRDDHNNNRGSKEAYDNVLRGLKLCTLYNRPKSIVIAGMKNNLDKKSLDGFLGIVRKYNSDFRINFLKPTQKEHLELFPSFELVLEAINYLMHYLEPVTLSEPAIAAYGGVKCSGCPCGIYSFRIKSKKNNRVGVTPCVYMDLDGGDILTEEIESIVNSYVFKQYTKRNLKIPRECKELNCEYDEMCRGGCTARTLLVTQDMERTDPYCLKKLEKDNNNSSFELAHDGMIRVHDNYLCTYIGKLRG